MKILCLNKTKNTRNRELKIKYLTSVICSLKFFWAIPSLKFKKKILKIEQITFNNG